MKAPWWREGRFAVPDPVMREEPARLETLAEGDLSLPPLTFTAVAGSAVTIAGGDDGFYTTTPAVSFACPVCVWQGLQDELLAHYEWHRRFAREAAVRALVRPR